MVYFAFSIIYLWNEATIFVFNHLYNDNYLTSMEKILTLISEHFCKNVHLASAMCVPLSCIMALSFYVFIFLHLLTRLSKKLALIGYIF